MTGNVLLTLSESDIGERPTAKSKSNHTVHRAAFEAVRLRYLGSDIRLLVAAGDRER